ncbi:MAG: ADP-ribosylglycohydrolase family protein [Bacteroidales bacterium]|nr:ADP-ribosylglycohydrolase family protein [Bacteroidales bacterium]
MLGAITGDVIGSRYEFKNTKEYEFPLFCKDSNYTDDSIMTLAVAHWLMNDKKLSYQGLEDAMLLFGKQFKCPTGGYGGGFRVWLFNPEALYDYDEKYGKAPYKSKTGRHPYGSNGNGSAMRVSAVGWFFDNLKDTERIAAKSARITHNDPEGIKGAKATAAAIFLARTGKTKEEIRDYIEKKYKYDLHKTYDYWHPIYKWESSCQGTVPQALICFLDSKDYVDAIRKAVSLGGDSDTLACITGGIAEAFYGPLHPYLQEKVLPLLPAFLKQTLTDFQTKYILF